MLFFKKLCDSAIEGIDHIIIEYNQFVSDRHPDYELTRQLGK